MRHRVGHSAAGAGGARAARNRRRRRVLRVAQAEGECEHHRRAALRHAGASWRRQIVRRAHISFSHISHSTSLNSLALLLFHSSARSNLNGQNGHNGKSNGSHPEGDTSSF